MFPLEVCEPGDSAGNGIKKKSWFGVVVLPPAFTIGGTWRVPSGTPASRCAAESRMQCKVTFAILVPSVTAPCGEGEGASLAPAIPRVAQRGLTLSSNQTKMEQPKAAQLNVPPGYSAGRPSALLRSADVRPARATGAWSTPSTRRST